MAKINVRDRNGNKQDKKPNWEYRFEAAKVDGKRRHISKAGFKTKKEALEAGAKAFAEYSNGGLKFEPTNMSVSDYLDYWFEKSCKVNLKYNTQVSYAQLIENHLKPKLGFYKLNTLTPAIIQEYANSIAINGYSRSMIVGIVSTLQVALDYAVHPLCFIRDNPVRYVKYPQGGKPKRERIVLEQEEFDRIIKRFPIGSRFYIPLMIGWHCGLRISETFGLTWDDIDFENKTLTVNKQILKRKYGEFAKISPAKQYNKDERFAWYFVEPKYQSSRTIKLGETLFDALKKEMERQEQNEASYGEYYTIYVTKNEKDEKNKDIVRIVGIPKGISVGLPRVKMLCVDENGDYTSTDSFKYAARIIHHELKITFDYHTLRHTHATMLIEAGVSPKAVQHRLGHKNIETTLQTYVHATDDLQQDAIDKFEQIINKKPK